MAWQLNNKMKQNIKKLLIKKMEAAFEDSYAAVNFIIRSYVNHTGIKNPKVLDLGSSSGRVTGIYLKGIDAEEIIGLDVLEPTKNKKIKFIKFDLEGNE